jgi:hypothetical protein
VSLVDVFHRFVYGFGDDGSDAQLGVEILGRADGSIRVRVRNGGAAVCRHYVVLIATGQGPVAAATGFDLAPGRARPMSLRLPAHGRPEPGQLIASVHTRSAQRCLALA